LQHNNYLSVTADPYLEKAVTLSNTLV